MSRVCDAALFAQTLEAARETARLLFIGRT